jgi:hypothetical protein
MKIRRLGTLSAAAVAVLSTMATPAVFAGQIETTTTDGGSTTTAWDTTTTAWDTTTTAWDTTTTAWDTTTTAWDTTTTAWDTSTTAAPTRCATSSAALSTRIQRTTTLHNSAETRLSDLQVRLDAAAGIPRRVSALTNQMEAVRKADEARTYATVAASYRTAHVCDDDSKVWAPSWWAPTS